MISVLLLLLLIAGGITFIYLGYRKILSAPLYAREDDGIKRHLSVKELGVIEGNILNLTEVIVIADKIEEPTNELLKSVQANLKKGVKYIFLISVHRYDDEKNSYWKIFQAIGEIIKHSYQIENSIEIFPLKFDWNDYPFVFYRYKEQETEKQKAFAYMGTELREGIADEYELINPTIACKMLDLAFKGVIIPEYEKITKEELQEISPKIYQLHKIA